MREREREREREKDTFLTHLPLSILISMAPLSQEVQLVSSCSPPHLGPAIAEMNSIWFKLWLYVKLGSGPISLLLAQGTRLRTLPKFIRVSCYT